MYQPSKIIILVGMMGVGKTTIGKKLANSFELPFVDLDLAIEEDQDCTISQIFEYAGEETFRQIETRILSEQVNGGVKILATGGGAFIAQENRQIIKQKATSIWLTARIGTLIDRTSKRNNRPLLESGNKGDLIKKLAEEREKYYSQADFSVATDIAPYSKIMENIVENIKKYDT